ncbi:MAG TPA: glycosyltransferase [Nitrospinota bacterium]|nr:glycosyltransferase [Nitrospinota bacterium]
MDKIDISVVIPIYNEAKNIRELYDRLLASITSISPRYELIFIDDGSTDNSFKVLKDLRSKDKKISILKFTRNFGQQSAVLAGFKRCQGKTIVQLDADLQNPPEEIPKLIRKLDEGYDIVSGIRKNRQDFFLREICSSFLAFLVSKLMGKNISLDISSFRVMRRSVIEKIKQCKDKSKFLSALVSWLGVPSAQVEVDHSKRLHGETKYRTERLLQLSTDLITGFSRFPLRMVSYLGFFGATIGFLLMMFLLFQRYVRGVMYDGFTVLAALFSLFAGVQLLSIGILGEYIGRIYSQVQDRPDYVIEEIIE